MEESTQKPQEESQKEKNPSTGSGQAKTPPRKAVVILGLIFVVLVIIIAIVGRGAPQRPPPAGGPAPKAESPDTKIGELEKTYESALFSFQYPSGWKRQLYDISGGGNGITIRPSDAGDTDYFPRLHIESAPSDPEASIEKRLDLLSWMKFERTDTTFQGNKTVKLSGRVPFLENGKPLDPPVRKTYIFFEKAGYLYIITYAYYEDGKAQEKEQFFSNILDTVTLPGGAL